MKKTTLSLLIISASFCTQGCQRSSGAVWEDTKTIGRHIQRKSKLLWNQDLDSRMISSADEFTGPIEEEYIPLRDADIKMQYADLQTPQPKATPVAKNSEILNIDNFRKPTAKLASIFKTLYFNTDESTLKGKEYVQDVTSIIDYMKKNPKLYIFIEGHCDERASEAYNLSLGTRRANTIKNLLIKGGVDSSRVYTISFGKEMPSDTRHSPEAWAKNRRVEFKIFEKN